MDFIFYPKRKDETGIILELKVDDSADNAIKQIKDKNYIQRYKGKVCEKSAVNEIVLVGIS